MRKIIFKCKFFCIRVRDLLLVCVAILLLFFCLYSSEHHESDTANKKDAIADVNKKKQTRKEKEAENAKKRTDEKKADKISKSCTFTIENMSDLDKLLTRADLCSTQWFQDLSAYRTRLEDQITLLKKRNDKGQTAILKTQQVLLKAIIAFEAQQNDQSVKTLKEALLKYQAVYENQCKKSGGRG